MAGLAGMGIRPLALARRHLVTLPWPATTPGLLTCWLPSRHGLAAARGYREHVATSPGRRRPVLLTGFATLMFGTAACSGHSIASHHPASAGQPPRRR